VIGTTKAVWNEALNIGKGDEDKPIPLFKAIKLWESNTAPEIIKGKMANIKTIMSNAIQAEYMRQLSENEDYRQYAPYVAGHLGPHSGRLFDSMVNSMMYIPSTGGIVMAPKAQPTQGETAEERLLRNASGVTPPAPVGGVTPPPAWGEGLRELPPREGGGLFGPAQMGLTDSEIRQAFRSFLEALGRPKAIQQ